MHMGWLTFGYFVSYIPYAMLVKALASGVTPLSTQPVNGFKRCPQPSSDSSRR